MVSRRKLSENETDSLIYRVSQASINRALAWRFVLATRLLGIRPVDDQAADGIRDLYETVMLLRCEMTAISTALVDAGIVARPDVFRRMGEVAEQMAHDYEHVFPGLWSDDSGTIQYDEARAHKEPDVPQSGQN